MSTTHAKASDRVIVDPLGWNDPDRRGIRPVYRVAEKGGVTPGVGYDDRKGVGPCDRGPSGLEDAGYGLFTALRKRRGDVGWR